MMALQINPQLGEFSARLSNKEWGGYFCADGAARMRRTEVRPM
jgi:hypothetical protein